jgi:hypothetical protein
MDYPFSKHKLPKGFSFPLKRSVLDALLDASEITGLSGVSFIYSSQSREILLRASFFGEAHKGWAAAGLTSLTFYAVPSGLKNEIESAMSASVLPRLCDWLRMVEQKGNAWRGQSRHLEFRWNEDTFTEREYST